MLPFASSINFTISKNINAASKLSLEHDCNNYLDCKQRNLTDCIHLGGNSETVTKLFRTSGVGATTAGTDQTKHVTIIPTKKKKIHHTSSLSTGMSCQEILKRCALCDLSLLHVVHVVESLLSSTLA